MYTEKSEDLGGRSLRAEGEKRGQGKDDFGIRRRVTLDMSGRLVNVRHHERLSFTRVGWSEIHVEVPQRAVMLMVRYLTWVTFLDPQRDDLLAGFLRERPSQAA
jgi:hypothetical protein